MLRHEVLDATRALLFRPFADDLDVHSRLARESTQRGEVDGDVALAICCTAPIPAAVAFGEFPRRRLPRVGVHRRLHVVVKVEQDGRGAGRTGDVSGHRLASVGGHMRFDVVHPDLGERRDQPLDHCVAIGWRLARGVVDGFEGDHLGEVTAGLRHQLVDAGTEGLDIV